MEYYIRFDENNSNLILIYKGGKMINFITCPPIKEGCDIIRFSDKSWDNYNYNFDGFVLITTRRDRKVYYKGKLIIETKRKDYK